MLKKVTGSEGGDSRRGSGYGFGVGEFEGARRKVSGGGGGKRENGGGGVRGVLLPGFMEGGGVRVEREIGLEEGVGRVMEEEGDCGGKWKDRIKEVLGNGWYMIGGERMGSVRLWVFGRDWLKGFVRDVESVKVATGFVDVGKNKGGVLVGFFVKDTGICFVGCHFAAHLGWKYLRERFVDYEMVFRKMVFGGEGKGDGGLLGVGEVWDFVVLMGDLNFRLCPPVGGFEEKWRVLMGLIGNGEYGKLCKFDELCGLMERKKLFWGFVEGDIDFAPSFKYTPGNKLPTASFNKCRLPAYCDRILYRVFPSRRALVKQLSYESLPSYVCSDHKPVRALFELAIPQTLPRLMLADPSTIRVCLDFHMVRLKRGFGKLVKTDILSKSGATSPTLLPSGADGKYIECPDSPVDDDFDDYGTMSSSSSDETSSASDDYDDDFPLFGSLNSDGPVQRDSISSQTGKKASTIAREVRMEVHGHAGVFLKPRRVYKAYIPKRTDGAREKSGESLPCIPLCPMATVKDLKHAHVVLSFRKPDHKMGASAVLPLGKLVDKVGQDYRFEMTLTKYGRPVGTMECVAELVVNREVWADAQGNTIKQFHGRGKRGRMGKHAVRMAAKVNAKVKHKNVISMVRSSPVVEVCSYG